jgi:hypothetical protein
MGLGGLENGFGGWRSAKVCYLGYETASNVLCSSRIPNLLSLPELGLDENALKEVRFYCTIIQTTKP